jgi:F420-0:gamma-glutamyl ligase-like protein
MVNLAAGLNMFSVPVNDTRIYRLSDLASFIGTEVTMIISYDRTAGKFVTYMPTFPETSPANVAVKGGVGYIVMMKEAKSVTFQGLAWSGDISLSAGKNLISIPVNPGIWRLSNLANFIGSEVTMIISYDRTAGKFVTYMPAVPETSPTNVIVEGGVGYIVMMKAAKNVTFTGEAWNMPPLGAPPMPLMTHRNVTATSVLVVEGAVCREDTGMELNGMKVTTRNLSVKQAATDSTGANAASGRYITTFVDLSGSHAAKVGDIFEVIVFDATGTFSGNLLRYTVTQQDIQAGIVSLDIMLSPIPKENTLLANYPNPFNPDTWIPYQLKEGTEVTILIYNISGQIVKIIYLGRKEAGSYFTKEKAAYWDGRNSEGEKVSSGVYFYTLQAGKFRATRKMNIIK